MNKEIENLRANKAVAWLFAMGMGLVFRYIYGLTKNSIFSGVRSYFGSSSATPPEIENVLFIIKFNFTIDLVSSFIAAVVCGALLVYIYREKSMTVIFHEHSATRFSRPFHQARRSELWIPYIT